MRLRTTIIGVAALAAFAVAPAGAVAADVQVVTLRSGTKTVSIGSLSARFDVARDYSLVSASSQTTKPVRGISVSELLKAAGAEPEYGAVTIARPNGGVVRLSKKQIDAGSPAPVVFEEGGQATFLRPSNSPDDLNADDLVKDSPLVITQVYGGEYDIKTSVSASKAKVGQELTFKASATGSFGQKLTYTWRFDDRSFGSGAEVRHKFKKRGNYEVIVTVRAEGEEAGSSKVIKVKVGEATKSNKNREGGGNNDRAGAPVSGQAEGNSGDGTTAGSQDSTDQPKDKQDQPQPAPEQLETVTGELLGVEETQAPPQVDLAARSGQQAQPAPGFGGIPGEAAGGAFALGLLGLGAALELGGAARLRRRLGT